MCFCMRRNQPHRQPTACRPHCPRSGCVVGSSAWVCAAPARPPGAGVGEGFLTYLPTTKTDPSSRARKLHTLVLKRARRYAIKRPVRAYLKGHLPWAKSISFAQVKQSLVGRIKPACVSCLSVFLAKISCRIAALRLSVRSWQVYLSLRR